MIDDAEEEALWREHIRSSAKNRFDRATAWMHKKKSDK